MDTSSVGGFIPLWILGAGFLIGIIELMRTPKPQHRGSYDQRRADEQAVPRTGAYQPARTAA